jgi:ketosteroid isomerase-like protein
VAIRCLTPRIASVPCGPAPERTRLIEDTFAEGFASDWIASWNAHDLDRVLAHYIEDMEMFSPVIVQIAGEPSGRLRGKPAVRAYWARALKLMPNLKFELLSVLLGVDTVTLFYVGAYGRLAAEVFHFGADRKVVRAYAHYVS